MFWVFTVLLLLYGLYCLIFCSNVLYTGIIEEWWCRNKIPVWIEKMKRDDYQEVGFVTETIEIGEV